MKNLQIEKQDWKALSAIQIGGAICLPVLLVGYELCKRVGILSAIFAIVVGNLLLFALAFVTSKMSYEAKKTTAENATSYFGIAGAKIFALLLAISLSFWFAIQSQVMSQDIVQVFGISTSTSLIPMVISLAIVGYAVSGVKSIERLAILAVPLMFITMLLALVIGVVNIKALPPLVWNGVDPAGISLVLATCILAVVDLPTFFRHAKCNSSAINASFVVFVVATPLIELLGALLYYTTGAETLIQSLFLFDNVLWSCWVSIFILMAGWTTNNTNLYSAASCLLSLKKGITEKTALALSGILLVVVSGVDFINRLILSLDLIGICISSMGGVILAGYCVKKQGYYRSNMFALALGIVGGFISHYTGGLITPVPLIDALIIAAFSVSLIKIEKLGVTRC